MKKHPFCSHTFVLIAGFIGTFLLLTLSCNKEERIAPAPENSAKAVNESDVQTGQMNYSPFKLRNKLVSSVIQVTDTGWHTETGTTDCSTGWTDDSWELTLTKARRLRVAAIDLYCPGDYFEIYVDNILIGTTAKPPTWGCGTGDILSSGSFSVTLLKGKHTIKVRDKGFDGHPDAEAVGMCPAGYIVNGYLCEEVAK